MRIFRRQSDKTTNRWLMRHPPMTSLHCSIRCIHLETNFPMSMRIILDGVGCALQLRNCWQNMPQVSTMTTFRCHRSGLVWSGLSPDQPTNRWPTNRSTSNPALCPLLIKTMLRNNRSKMCLEKWEECMIMAFLFYNTSRWQFSR